MERLTYGFVKNQFATEGFTLLSKTYKNAHQQLYYVCCNGHYHHISWNNWKKGVRCPYCSSKAKHLIDYINELFLKEGYNLISSIYINVNTKLKYICPNGHEHHITFSKWLQGRRCPYCCGNIKHSLNFIKFEFAKEGYKLLTIKYINNKQLLNFVCPNGHNHCITWNDWIRGNRCGICWNDLYRSGNNSPNWKGGISCEPYCDAWTDKEYKESIKDSEDVTDINVN